jgi:hypothetical protein
MILADLVMPFKLHPSTATEGGHVDIVKFLIHNGSQCMHADAYIAAQSGNKEILEYIL